MPGWCRPVCQGLFDVAQTPLKPAEVQLLAAISRPITTRHLSLPGRLWGLGTCPLLSWPIGLRCYHLFRDYYYRRASMRSILLFLFAQQLVFSVCWTSLGCLVIVNPLQEGGLGFSPVWQIAIGRVWPTRACFGPFVSHGEQLFCGIFPFLFLHVFIRLRRLSY